MVSEPPKGYGKDFLEQILTNPSSYNNIEHHQQQTVFPLGLNLDNGAHLTPNHQQQQHQQQQQRERGEGNMNMSGLVPLDHRQFENNMHPSQQHSLLHTVPQAFQGQPTVRPENLIQETYSIMFRGGLLGIKCSKTFTLKIMMIPLLVHFPTVSAINYSKEFPLPVKDDPTSRVFCHC
nr:transcription factor UNE12-like [Tanacetum cinerariifolium]